MTNPVDPPQQAATWAGRAGPGPDQPAAGRAAGGEATGGEATGGEATGGEAAASTRPGTDRETGAGPAAPGRPISGPQARDVDRELTVSIPLDRVAGMVTAPLAGLGRVLSSRGGLPVYVGLGVVAAADVIEWPIAAALGVGYALLRRWDGARNRPASRPWERLGAESQHEP